MKIALFGGTGRVGRAFLEQALNEGHNVRMLVRDPSKIENIDKNAEIIKGNARDIQSIEKTVSGCDAVVSCLGTDGDDTLTVAVPLVVEAMRNERITRVITIGTAGILQARSNPDLYRFQSNESKRTLTRAANEHLNVYQTLKESNLQWTIVCPTYLPDGELTKKYRFEENYLPEDGKQISAEDTGYFTYQVLIEKSFIRKRVGLAY
ncbi:SDR family oxidoreductase [Metabacillus idriensis]|uniref:NAD(P)-dependent oxidoreductase n=1 Tax=Metabacillus idriensis TaxID=324768 RepID=UPI0028143AB3|nr:SDR family oxidoreductase [Metabacillus idriensis]MDR0136278.1 SDR family oxidoreductase [Metabacillus idriensis]